MFGPKRRIPIALAAAVAATLAGIPAYAQQEATSTTANDQLEEVVVTGSLIRRTDTETPSPVQVVTAEDIQNSGLTTISEVLRNLSSNGAGTLSQSFNYAFEAGAS